MWFVLLCEGGGVTRGPLQELFRWATAQGGRVLRVGTQFPKRLRTRHPNAYATPPASTQPSAYVCLILVCLILDCQRVPRAGSGSIRMSEYRIVSASAYTALAGLRGHRQPPPSNSRCKFCRSKDLPSSVQRNLPRRTSVANHDTTRSQGRVRDTQAVALTVPSLADFPLVQHAMPPKALSRIVNQNGRIEYLVMITLRETSNNENAILTRSIAQPLMRISAGNHLCELAC
ncbi:hypothetical protein Q31a_08240 [Aureliella helgolandensis]|uniref:Uncharacterized protein n=1 Tax=Aureliella helgolandensis TaxID=2527968 RepID=A0A518G1R3_9BACT|nr:hypothetical protein Q31a_08240 [Aureliella helgolandensis]